MKKVAILFGLACLPLLFFAVMFVSTKEVDTKVCGTDMAIAAQEIVNRDFGATRAPRVSIEAINSIMCARNGNIANAALVVKVKKGQYAYAIMNIHFDGSGHLLPTEGSRQSWPRTLNRNDWVFAWCELIRGVYTDEIDEQGCDA